MPCKWVYLHKTNEERLTNVARKPVIVSPEEMQKQQEAIEAIFALPNKPTTFHIITYGCQMNSHDSEKLAGLLSQMGIDEVKTKEDADFVIFNTCAIRENAERRALGNINWLNELRKQKPNLLIGVCGCMIQQAHMAEKILKQYRFIDIAFGTHNLHNFPEMFLERLSKKHRVVSICEQDCLIAEGLPVKRLSKQHAFITIMYGCDNYCTFCVVPSVRGRERSRKMSVILKEAQDLYEDGVQEIMLLGQNVNSYGTGSEEDVSFPKLLQELDKIGIPRIRFMTSHPKDLSDELITVMANSKHICHQFHLPVQSGNNHILKRMNRHYTREDYLSKVQKLRNAMPDIGLTTDLIVGFPGETDEQFEETCSLVKEVGFTSAFTFIYSPRVGTAAAKMPEQVDKEVTKERIQKLISICENNTDKAHHALIGKEDVVLVENISRKNEDMVVGKGSRGITFTFPGTEEDIGKCIPVLITDAKISSLIGVRKEA